MRAANFFGYAYMAAGVSAFACLVVLIFALASGGPLGVEQYLLPLFVVLMMAAKAVAAKLGRANG